MKAYALCSIEQNADAAGWLGQQIGFVTFRPLRRGYACHLEFLLHEPAAAEAETADAAFRAAFDALPQYRHDALGAVIYQEGAPSDWQALCGLAGIAVLPATPGA